MIEMNTIHYYFGEKCLEQAFTECYSVIFAELTTEKAMQLSNQVIIEHTIDDDDQNSEFYKEYFEDGDIYIETPRQLKRAIEYLVADYCTQEDIVAIYLNEKDILNRLDDILIELEDNDSVTKDFSITLYKNSNAETLFNVIFARGIQFIDISNNEETIDYIIDYDDFDYSAITEFIDQIIMHIAPDFDFQFDHIDGETQSDKEFLDLYYKFDKK
jgi:hypothetical protein